MAKAHTLQCALAEIIVLEFGSFQVTCLIGPLVTFPALRWAEHVFDVARCHGPLTRYVKSPVAHAPGMTRIQRKLLVSDPSTHHGTCVTHVPWCMSGSLTCGGGENVPGIPGACATRNSAYLARGPCSAMRRINNAFNTSQYLTGSQWSVPCAGVT